MLLARLQSDLLPALQAACAGELGDFDLRWTDQAAVAVVMAARGYPCAGKGPRSSRGWRQPLRSRASPYSMPVPRRTPTGRSTPPAAARADDLRHRGGCVAGAHQGLCAVDAIVWPEGFCRRDIAARAAE